MRNSLLIEVLREKKGIPIMLSIIYMELAFHVGLKVEPINYPGNFLVSLQLVDEPQDEEDYEK